MEAALIALIFCGFALIVFVVCVLAFPEEMRSVVSRTASFRVGARGVAWTFFEEAVETKEHRKVKRREAVPAMRKLSRGRILWVDDAPANNRLEAQALRSLGVEIDAVTSNEEALRYAAARTYDLVLSDIDREPPQEKRAGLALPAQLRGAGHNMPIGHYVGHATGPRTPDGQPVFDKPTALLGFVAEQLGGGGE